MIQGYYRRMDWYFSDWREDAELVANVKDLKSEAGFRCNGASSLIDEGTALIRLLPME